MVLVGLLFQPLSLPVYLAAAPLGVLVYRHGARPGLITVVALSLLAGLGDPIWLMRIPLALGPGFVLGEALRNGFGAAQAYVMATAAAMAGYLANDFVEAEVLGFDLYAELEKAFQELGGGFVPGGGDAAALIEQFRLLHPSVRLIQSLLLAFALFWFMRRLLRRRGAALPWFPPFDRWRFPWHFVWGFLLGQGISLFRPEGAFWQAASINLILISMFFLQVQGIALGWFFLRRHRAPWLFAFLLVLSLAMPAMFGLWFLAGALDAWFDFRKIGRQKGESS